MIPYENHYIGAFIYTLGLAAREKFETISCLSLLQQTPQDKPLGDLLGSWSGKNFLIEFKRSEKGLAEERQKPKFLQILNDLNDIKNADKKEFSLRGHFISYGVLKDKMPTLAFRHYAFASTKLYDHNMFVELLSNQASEVGIKNIDDFKAYVDFLMKRSKGDPLFGIAVNISSSGAFNFIMFDSINELALRLGLDQNKIQSKKIVKGIDENKNRGMGGPSY